MCDYEHLRHSSAERTYCECHGATISYGSVNVPRLNGEKHPERQHKCLVHTNSDTKHSNVAAAFSCDDVCTKRQQAF